MTQTALVLGTNAGQADLIRFLKAGGWHVVGCSGKIGEPGQALCDTFVLVDIRDVNALIAVTKVHRPDLIYSISSDLAIKSVVELAEQMGVQYYYDAGLINLLDNKAALRAFLADHNLSPVGYRQVSSPADVTDWDSFPCVVKPTDGQGQRGVQKVLQRSDLAEAVTAAIQFSSSRQAIVEDFLDGVEVSCNVFIWGGRPCVQILSERLVHEGEKIGIPRGHLVPVQNVSEADEIAAMNLVTRTVAALDQKAGPLYFQMIITPAGPRIVEIAPRLDGCHMWRVIEAATGIDLIDLCVKGLTGRDVCAGLPSLETQRTVTPLALMFQQVPPHTPFHKASFPVPADAIYHEYRYCDGEDVSPINGTLEVVGYTVHKIK